jgi:DNA-binding MarR family transcriptional regulator
MSENIEKLQFGTILKMFRELSEEGNIHNYALKWKLTYSTVRKNIYEFERLGFITTEKNGRQMLVKLTDSGRKLSLLFKQINNILEEEEICLEGKNRR